MSDKPKSTRVMFACNDYRNGHGQGWFDQISLHGCEIEIECPRTVIRSLGNGRVRIGRMVFEHHGWSEWVGNWCWDELAIVDAKRLLRMLRAKGAHCSCGPSKFYNWFNHKLAAK